jgi:predicted CXXCH cytochrome family protein
MTTCPTCHQPATTRDGFDRRGRQRFACRPCHRVWGAFIQSVFTGLDLARKIDGWSTGLDRQKV